MDTKSVVLAGAELPQVLKDAISRRGKDFSVCRISHEGKQVALVSTDWIQLILRLEQSAISTYELDQLFDLLVGHESHPSDSHAVAAWARKLSPLI